MLNSNFIRTEAFNYVNSKNTKTYCVKFIENLNLLQVYNTTEEILNNQVNYKFSNIEKKKFVFK